MKKNVRYEESFIFSIDRKRRHVNEMVVCITFILAFAWALIGAPIIIVLCDVPVWSYPIQFVGPIVLATLILVIRKRIIMTRFIRIDDVRDRVDLTEIQSSELETIANGKVFMFASTDYMVKVLYNWLYTMGVVGDDKLKMYKVFFDNHAPIYLAIREADLVIPADVVDRFKEETAMCLQLSDMVGGKAVDIKVCERVTSERDAQNQ